MNTLNRVAVLPKSMWESKTFWVNVLVGLVAVIGELQALLPDLADFIVIPAWVARLLLLLAAVANIILRRISDTPARFTPENERVLLEKAPSMFERVVTP